MSNPTNKSFRFLKELDYSVDKFFSNIDLENWSLPNFISYKNYDNADRANEFIFLQEFKENIQKILKNQNVDAEVKGIIGHIFKNEQVKIKDKQPVRKTVSNIAVGTNKGNFTVNNNSTSIIESNKKQKANHTQRSTSWMIDSEGDIWEAWRQYLEEHNGYHKYSMEKYHIIKCGYSIRCNPNIPLELYEHIGFSNDGISTQVIPCPFITCKKYSTLVFKSMESNKHWKQVEEIVINSCEEKKGLGSRDVDFVESFFRFCILLFKKPNLYERLKISECNFNRLLIWPAMEVAVDSISCSDLSFMSAEYKLKSSDEEYKADACVLDDDNNEISILETSGKFMLDDNSKYGYDHVKCTFGALIIFNAAFKKYFWSREDTGLQLRIPFIHARHDMLHLWSLELCSSKLYISKKIYKCVVPANITDVKDILALGNLVWLYREELEKTVKTLKKMKKEHNSYEFERMLGSDDARESLSKMVNSDIQRPVQGAGFGILLPEKKDDEENVVRFIKAED